MDWLVGVLDMCFFDDRCLRNLLFYFVDVDCGFDFCGCVDLV